MKRIEVPGKPFPVSENSFQLNQSHKNIRLIIYFPKSASAEKKIYFQKKNICAPGNKVLTIEEDTYWQKRQKVFGELCRNESYKKRTQRRKWASWHHETRSLLFVHVTNHTRLHRYGGWSLPSTQMSTYCSPLWITNSGFFSAFLTFVW